MATSNDGGATFDAYHSPLTDAIADNDAWALTVASSGDGQTLVAASEDWFNTTGGISYVEDVYVQGDGFLSADGGASFSPVSLPDRSIKTDFIAVSMSADGQNIIFAAKTRNGFWEDVRDNNTTSLFTFNEEGPGDVTFWLSSDSGSTWTRRVLMDVGTGKTICCIFFWGGGGVVFLFCLFCR